MDEDAEAARAGLEKDINDLMQEDERPFECPHCHNRAEFLFFFGWQKMKLRLDGTFEVIIDDRGIAKSDNVTFICGNPDCHKVVLETLMY